MYRATMLMACWLLAAPALADDSRLATGEQTRQLCATAAAAFADGDSDAAFAALTPHWPLPRDELDALATQTKTLLAGVAERFGAPLGHEHLSSVEVGSSLVRHTQLVKFERHAIRLNCLFYKPEAHWLVNAVAWDDQVSELFD